MTIALTVLRNARVYAPQPLGVADLVPAGRSIAAILERGTAISGIPCTQIDVQGRIVCPGFVDNHVHVLGCGGLGFSSRAPEIQASQLARAGITSVVGMFGFDATTKSMAALLAKKG